MIKKSLGWGRYDIYFLEIFSILAQAQGWPQEQASGVNTVLSQYTMMFAVVKERSVLGLISNNCKWFEPRSISSLLSVIVQVSIVLKRTVVVDND